MRRPWLLPLVPLYGAGLWVKRQFLSGQSRRLQQPVISVGSLSAGGAGKTPVVLALAKLLKRSGYNVDVLSRGYGRTSYAVARVNPEGTAEEFGDEPLLMARAGLDVWVGADRYRAGCMAEDVSAGVSAGERRVHLLDDGFQHQCLARALDVIVLTIADVEDWLLPAGNLREPLSRLRAAGAVVLREEEAARLRPIVRQWAGEMPVWVIRREIAVVNNWGLVLAFCGIARPEQFLAELRDNGVKVVAAKAFRDHHPFSTEDIEGLVEETRHYGAEGFLTTEKDAMRLTPAMRARLEVIGPVEVAKLTIIFLEEEAVLNQVRNSFAG